MRAYYLTKDITPAELPSTLSNSAPEPKCTPGSNEVLIDVHSAAFNFFDILAVQGKYQVKTPHPYVPGAEMAGIISKDSPIPEGCDFIPGKTRVFGAVQGAYGEKAKADYWQLMEVPEGISFEQAAGLFITWPTSYAALKYRADVKEGEWVLVHAGAGGAMGAKVIATAGSEDKLKVCKKFGGADYAINYRDKNWQDQVKKITEGYGADVVYDPVGMIVPSLKVIAWNGRIIVVGFAAGTIEKIPANLVLLKNCAITGVHWGAYVKNEPDKIGETWEGLLEMFKTKQVIPTVFDHIYEGLESVPEGLKDLADRKTWGKAVVRIRADPEHPPKGKHKL
ncbi:related to quinone reductase [Melanopsichium pennsylvanicum]|uniref:Related to quinone reductase n=2 Tax=Melanopsichium pennsylvanicum TaxID=63383 RepID=A0AAJ5C2B1_9BASI|nr:related to quinone reductase [Melanopsichium pennsylvanicum 4]SNX81346.1 related to quinone reductase [Melanopsichium pennsylvanicum]